MLLGLTKSLPTESFLFLSFTYSPKTATYNKALFLILISFIVTPELRISIMPIVSMTRVVVLCSQSAFLLCQGPRVALCYPSPHQYKCYCDCVHSACATAGMWLHLPGSARAQAASSPPIISLRVCWRNKLSCRAGAARSVASQT